MVKNVSDPLRRISVYPGSTLGESRACLANLSVFAAGSLLYTVNV
jgi:hypothetical protein